VFSRTGCRLRPQLPGGPSNTPAHGVPHDRQWPLSSRFHSVKSYQSRPITAPPQPVQNVVPVRWSWILPH
jgi:hypothetical protein